MIKNIFLIKETFGKTTLIEWAVYSTKVTNKNDVHYQTEHKKLNMVLLNGFSVFLNIVSELQVYVVKHKFLG